MSEAEVGGASRDNRDALVVHDPNGDALSDLVVGLAQSDLTTSISASTASR
jgi:hypothetical protein